MPLKKSLTEAELAHFVRLHSDAQRPLLAFIQTLVYGWANAEEVLQETNITIWEKREDFDLDTNFMHWGKRIAYYKVLQFREKNRKNHALRDETMDLIATDMMDRKTQKRDPKSDALENCIQKLSEKDQKLLQQRYFDDTDVQDISATLGRPSRAVYVSLQRIRNSLRACILRTLAMEGQD